MCVIRWRNIKKAASAPNSPQDMSLKELDPALMTNQTMMKSLGMDRSVTTLLITFLGCKRKRKPKGTAAQSKRPPLKLRSPSSPWVWRRSSIEVTIRVLPSTWTREMPLWRSHKTSLRRFSVHATRTWTTVSLLRSFMVMLRATDYHWILTLSMKCSMKLLSREPLFTSIRERDLSLSMRFKQQSEGDTGGTHRPKNGK